MVGAVRRPLIDEKTQMAKTTDIDESMKSSKTASEQISAATRPFVPRSGSAQSAGLSAPPTITSAAAVERRETLHIEESKSSYAVCVQIIDGASNDWMQSRRMTYAAIYNAGLALPYIGSPDFKKLCDDRKATKAGGNFPETRLVFMFAKGLQRDRRADVAAAMCWMHTPSLCGGRHGADDREVVIDYFIKNGCIDKCAAAYREWITEHGKPGDFGYQTEATKKGMATRRRSVGLRRRDPATAAAEADITISPEAVAKIVEAEETKPAIIIPTRKPIPEVEDEEFLEDLNLRDAVDRKVANLTPVAAIEVGTKVVPDLGVYIIRKVGDLLQIYGPVIDQNMIRAALRLLPEAEMPSERLAG
jgi:hypothetical protein